MGAVAFEYMPLFKRSGVKLFSANFALYGDMSNRMMSILSQYSPIVEKYSIDESFIDLYGFNVDFKEHGTKIRDHINKWIGIRTGVGIANTKALCKVANHIAKKFPEQTGGVHVIDTEEKRIKALKWFKAEEIWGIGDKSFQKLVSAGVKNAYEFTLLPESWVRKKLSITGLRLQYDLRGIPAIGIEQEEIRKSISTTRSFDQKYYDKAQVKDRIIAFVSNCAQKMRDQRSLCSKMEIFIETSPFEEPDQNYSKSLEIKLPFTTNSTLELISFAIAVFEKIYLHGYGYKRAGVKLSDFVQEYERQQKIFEDRNPKHIALMKTMDKINSKYPDGVHSAGYTKRNIMRQEHLSPNYTTDINQTIVVNF
ncbi:MULTISPECIES: DUF4113 domain-containing protein [unclassified Proteiniphilum]|jgi:DNA polymerase V|uniref:DinB/UmuC family translesion DNA polymerase n=1 Tax=Proteiniphilum sp. UBA5310 TaxID=1947275 RepID=UPI00257C5136|nr:MULTISPECIES: DUF4113 domain-containing protein [unclassified Proteiniphilum]